jgi:hypothetical protein
MFLQAKLSLNVLPLGNDARDRISVLLHVRSTRIFLPIHELDPSHPINLAAAPRTLTNQIDACFLDAALPLVQNEDMHPSLT